MIDYKNTPEGKEVWEKCSLERYKLFRWRYHAGEESADRRTQVRLIMPHSFTGSLIP